MLGEEGFELMILICAAIVVVMVEHQLKEREDKIAKLDESIAMYTNVGASKP